MQSFNKLGLDDIEAEEASSKIVARKAEILTEKMTFGCPNYDLEYLCKLHDFLFGDVYYNTDMISDRYKGTDLTEIERKIEHIFSLICGKEDMDEIKREVADLVDMQLFDDGNNRTITLFVRQIIDTWRITDDKYYTALYEHIKNTGRRL